MIEPSSMWYGMSLIDGAISSETFVCDKYLFRYDFNDQVTLVL